jgi:hypothetical protein
LDVLPIQNDLKNGDALSPFLANFILGLTIKKVKENNDERPHHTVNCAAHDPVTLFGRNINTIQKITNTILDISKEVNVE